MSADPRAVDASARRSYAAEMPPREQSPSELVTMLDSLIGDRLQRGEALLVASDGDNTLWRGDVGDALFEHAIRDRYLRDEALEPLLVEAAKHGLEVPTREVHEVASQLYDAHRAGRYPDRDAFAMMAWCFVGWPEDELGAYADEVLERFDFSSARRRELDPLHAWFERSGVPLWLVSASPRAIAVMAAARLGVPAERVVAMTPAALDGVVQAELEGAPTYGAGKLERLRAQSSATLLAAMGDSDYDLALLAAAEVAVAVHPNEGLRRRLGELDSTVVTLSAAPPPGA